jgi:hypothetical protein
VYLGVVEHSNSQVTNLFNLSSAIMGNSKNWFTAWEEAQIEEEGCSIMCPLWTRNKSFLFKKHYITLPQNMASKCNCKNSYKRMTSKNKKTKKKQYA